MFSVPVLIFDGSEGVGSLFHVLRTRTHFRRYRGRLVQFSCFMLPNSFLGGSEGFGTRFLCFSRYLRRRVPFSCFALPDTSSTVRRASGPVFMFCTSELIFGGSEGFGSRFHILCARTHFRRYLRCRVLFSCFASPYSLSAFPRASVPVFLFCAPEIIFDGSEGVRSSFHVLRPRTNFR
jgi:hypothetical protein